jgi:S1-C subfamily serine protease
MPRVLLVFLVLCLGALPGRAEEPVFRPFDPSALQPAETRLLQAALAAAGDYRGALDGAWGAGSQAALDAYAAREFGAAPLNLHAAAAVLGFLDVVQRDGWKLGFRPELGVSLALPLATLGPPEDEDGGVRRWSLTGSLTVLTQRLDSAEAAAWHDAAAKANRAPALYTVRRPELRVTAGALRDGRRFYTRSDRVAGGWATVFLASADDQAAALSLVAGSIRPGPPLAWALPEHGVMARLVAETEGFVAEAERARPDRPALAPPAAAALPQPGSPASTGTAFYLDARTLVTARHVIGDCARVTLADGTELTLLAQDAELDVAALMAPDPAPRWLSLADGAGLRLGQRVHAAGFPYYSIAGTSLHLTGGNVSALAGVDDDARFFSFTAPVQPGNSGGPLIDARGGVLGLVVARLSEDFIAEATGSLPQNVNYALTEAELAGFLRRSGVAPAPGGLGGYDMDEGVPDGFNAAVVPIVCE